MSNPFARYEDSKPAAQCLRCFLITFQDDRVCLRCRRKENDSE